MPQTKIINAKGKEAGSVELVDSLFAAPVNEALIHQAVVRQQAQGRMGTADTQTRAMVAGGGRKPWRQKGTGRARQGSRRAPHWRGGGVVFGPHPRDFDVKMNAKMRGGGVVFGPHPRDFDVKMNAKMRRAALRGVLSAKQAEGALRVVETPAFDEPRTRTMVELLDAWKAEGKVLLVLAGRDPNLEKSCDNLRELRVLLADSLNVVDLLEADTVVFTREALARAQEVYA